MAWCCGGAGAVTVLGARALGLGSGIEVGAMGLVFGVALGLARGSVLAVGAMLNLRV